MAIFYTNAGTVQNGTGALTVPVPTGYIEGDFLLLVISGRSALPALPDGWTNINTTNNSTYIYNRTCYKIATASESSVSVADSGVYTVARMFLFAGVDSTNPIDTSGVNTSSGTAFSATGITTGVANAMVVHAITFQDAGTVADTSNYGTPANANLTGILERMDNYYYSSSGVNGGICLVTGTKAAAGATGNTTSTADAAGNYSAVVTFSLRPSTSPQVAYTNKGAQAYGTGAITVAVPTGYAAGDLLVLHLVGKSALPELPSGWTNINTHNNSTNVYTRVCYKIATASESSVSVADSGTYTTGIILLFKGNDTTSPIDTSGVSTSSGTAYTGAGVTTTTNKCLIVNAIGFIDAGTSADTSNYGAPTNANLLDLLERQDYLYTSGAAIQGGICIQTGYKHIAGAVGNTTATADISTNYSATVQFAIKPLILIPHTLTITYKDAQGNTLATNHSSQVDEGASYSINSPTISGYVPDQAVVSGTMGLSDVTVTVTYTETPKHTLTIYYRYSDSSTAATTYSAQYDESATYSVTSPTISDYTPSQATVSGTMGSSDISVTVTYTQANPTLTLTPNVSKIGVGGRATATVEMNVLCSKIEARATINGDSYGRGIGINVLSDDVTTDGAGVHTFATPIKTWSFDIEQSELVTDGNYQITVYVQNIDGIWSVATQELDPYTVLLIHFDGANNSTTFVEETGKSLTRTGSTNVISTANSKFGGSSYYNPTVGSNTLTTPNTSDLWLGSGDFTLEAWVYKTGTPQYSGIIVFRTITFLQSTYAMAFSGNKPTFDYSYSGGSTTGFTYSSDIPMNEWVHVAMVRHAGYVDCYINGVRDASRFNIGTNSLYNSTATIKICGYTDLAFVGYVDEIRVSKGIARWTSNFTPPTAPYTLYK